MKTLKISILGLLVLGLGACTGSGNNTNIELIQDMMESPAVRPQEYEPFFPDHVSERVPPEHTVPVGFKAYKPGFDPNLAKADRNPFAGQMTDEVLLTGQKYFDTNCMVCHGPQGRGDGPVSLKMPNKPPALISEKIRGWADGQIYQVITMGQGTMGSYASHIPQKYRWQVVNYIRHLQQTNK
jgi:mono/diheme cytochrome c family protein